MAAPSYSLMGEEDTFLWMCDHDNASVERKAAAAAAMAKGPMVKLTNSRLPEVLGDVFRQVVGTSNTYEGSLTEIWAHLAFMLRANDDVKLLRIHGALPDVDMLRCVEQALVNGGYLFEKGEPWAVREDMLRPND